MPDRQAIFFLSCRRKRKVLSAVETVPPQRLRTRKVVTLATWGGTSLEEPRAGGDMKQKRSYGSKYHRAQLNIAWEAIRRSSEYREDFQSIGRACTEAQVGELTPQDDLPDAIQTKLRGFRNKWRCHPFPPELTLEEIEENLGQLYRQAEKGEVSSKVQEELKHEREWRCVKGKEKFPTGPDFPKEFGGMYNRLKGFKRGIDTVVRCREGEEMMAKLRELCGLNANDKLPPPKEWGPRLLEGGWSPPKRIHLTINLDVASEKVILERVRKEVRYYQKLRKILGLSPTLRRYHLDIYPDCFKVHDLFEVEGKTADEIAPLMWPREYEKHGGRDTTTAEKGALIQRAYDYRDRAKEIIKEMVDQIREQGIKI